MEGIFFPGLGIFFSNVPSGFTIFGFEVKFYGLIIALGFMLALVLAIREGKHTGFGNDEYLDYWLWMIIPTILGARIYYILFNLSEYVGEGISFGESLRRMIDIRQGGLGIYGGIIAGVTVSWIYTKKKKIKLPHFADNIVIGILIGQIMGRWGNFFNREVFGSYTSGFLRMGIPVEYYRSEGLLSYYQGSGVITDEMMNNTEIIRDQECITVVPSFLLEGLWNLAILLFILWYRKRKKFDGELSMMYIAFYGIGRFLIEGNRTDSLMIGPLKVSQVVAVLCVITGVAVLVRNYLKLRRGGKVPLHPWKKDYISYYGVIKEKGGVSVEGNTHETYTEVEDDPSENVTDVTSEKPQKSTENKKKSGNSVKTEKPEK